MQLTRESILSNALRAFCVCFASVVGIAIAGFVLLLASLSFSPADHLPPPAEIEILPDGEGKRNLLSESAPTIVQLDIHGVIGEGDLKSSKFENLLLDLRGQSFRYDRVKGILLHIDSPGGTVCDTDAMYRALLSFKDKYKIPVFAYVDGFCASGAMYLACACDKIYATPSSVIGSVGVLLGPAFNFSQVMQNWGIQSLTITQGKDKDMLNPFRSWQPGEEESLRQITAASYQRFVDIVLAARPEISRHQLVEEYGAQVYIAAKAEQLGYIDNSGADYSSVITAVAVAAGISQDEPYQVIRIRTPKNFFVQLSERESAIFSGKIRHTFDIGPYITSEMSGKLLYLYQPFIGAVKQ